MARNRQLFVKPDQTSEKNGCPLVTAHIMVKGIKETGYHLLLIPAAILMGFPFLWMVSASLKSGSEVFSSTISLIPESWQWHNYVTAWNSAPFDIFFLNSLLMAVGVIMASHNVFIGCLCLFSYSF